MKKKILLALAVIFIGLQFMSTDKTLPDRDPGKDFFAIGNDQPEMAALIKTACYDCHSHETKYPGYTAIQPVGKWVQGHIETGRKNINFSEWTDYSPEDQKHALKECAEVLEEKRMPLLPYMILHGDAWLSPEQRGDMAAYFKGRAAQL